MTGIPSVHWIPTHRGDLDGTPDRDIFARWSPEFVKIVCVDERVPYTEDVPRDAKIVIRLHPMSENYGQRGFIRVEDPRRAMVAASVKEAVGQRYRNWPGSPEYITTTENYSPIPRSLNRSVLDAEWCAIRDAETCERMARYCESRGIARSRLLFEGLNEPHLWADEPPELTAAYYAIFLTRLHITGLHGVALNAGVGWPGNGGRDDAPPQWEPFAPMIGAMNDGDYLGLHEYWALNGPQQNWGWWAGRFQQCPYDVPILITECGIDTGVTQQWYGGWRDLPGGSEDEKAIRYVNELAWYMVKCAADSRKIVAFPFTYDIGSPHWEKFDIRGWAFLNTMFFYLDAMPVDPPVDPPVYSDPPQTDTTWIVPAVYDKAPQAAGNYASGVAIDIVGNFANGWRVVFSGHGPDGEWATQPAITGPHAGYTWDNGYYSHVLHVPGPIAADWWLWIVDADGKRISDIAAIRTDGPGGTANQCTVDWIETFVDEEDDRLLPEDEHTTTVDVLADKVRWWTEEAIRQREMGDEHYADAIMLSLVDLQAGLMYRLENALKALPDDVLAEAVG